MILITGATGLVGGQTARVLEGLGVASRALVRRESTYGDSRWPSGEVVAGDFERPESLRTALDGIDAALLVSPATPAMVRQQSAFVEAAARVSRGRRPIRIVKVSGFLTGPDSPSRSGRWHAEIEARIEATGLPATCLRMPFFMQNLLRSDPPPIVSGILRLPLPSAQIAMVDARDVATVAAHCLLDDAHAGKRYLLTGPEAASIADVASCLAEASGCPVRHEPDTLDEARSAWAAAGTPRWRIEVVTEFYRSFETGAGETVSSDVRRVTGTPPSSLARFVREHLSSFGG